MLYNHFADKDELLLAGLAARAETLLAAFRAACPEPGTGTLEANLGRIAAALLELQGALLPLLGHLIAKRALLDRFLAELHGPRLGGPAAILGALDGYLSAERRLGRVGDAGDAHLAGILLLAVTQLQALVLHVAPAPAPDPELAPFVGFLAARVAPAATTRISAMLAVDDAPRAAEWYGSALGATVLWSLGSVAGLEIDGAPFFLHEPTDRFVSPHQTTTVRVEVFVDDPDAFVRRAVAAGADGSEDGIEDHEVPWGVHRQGGFRDPFGHVWLVGDPSPLRRFPAA